MNVNGLFVRAQVPLEEKRRTTAFLKDTFFGPFKWNNLIKSIYIMKSHPSMDGMDGWIM